MMVLKVWNIVSDVKRMTQYEPICTKIEATTRTLYSSNE